MLDGFHMRKDWNELTEFVVVIESLFEDQVELLVPLNLLFSLVFLMSHIKTSRITLTIFQKKIFEI